MDITLHKPWLVSLKNKIHNPPALFLDFDGTLTPIAPHPDQALLDPSTRGLIQSLCKHLPIVVISGRGLSDVKKRVGLSRITYVGNHGFEISNRKIKFQMKNETQWRRFLKKLRSQLEEDLENLQGVWVEDKGITLSIHYRLAGGTARRRANFILQNRVNELNNQGKIRLSSGKAVWEIRPPIEWNKGKAVLWVLKQEGFKRRWPIYIGDDETDQDAMRMIQKKGIGIAVGPPAQKGAAHYTLESPREVHHLLKWFLENLPPSTPTAFK